MIITDTFYFVDEFSTFLYLIHVKTNYHTLQVLKTADPKLRKAIISKCNKDVVHCISECILNVLNGNIKLTGSDMRKLQKHKAALCKVSDKHVPLSAKNKLIVQGGDSCCLY